MTEYIVGLDSMYQIEADTPEEAEAELARRISEGEIDTEERDAVVYEEITE